MAQNSYINLFISFNTRLQHEKTSFLNLFIPLISQPVIPYHIEPAIFNTKRRMVKKWKI